MFPFPSLPWFELARFQRNRLSRAALVAVAIVPLFYGVLYVLANWNPTGNLDRVHAAVVNLDQPVTTTSAAGRKQTVPLGRSLAGKLTGNTSKQNFDWELTDSADAATGLADGDYAAVVTIPKNFSAAATSPATSDDGTHAEQARLSVQTNDAHNYLVGTIARSVSTATTDALNAQVTGTYLDNIYVGFTDLHTQIGKAAKGATELSDGAGTLADGATKTHRGAAQLAAGLDQLQSRTRGLPGQTSQLNRGAQQVSDGADRLAAGTSTVNAGLQPIRRALRDLPSDTRQLADGAARISTVTGEIADGAGQLATGADNVSAGANGVASGLSSHGTQLDQLSADCAASGASASYCAQLAKVAGDVAPLTKAATNVAAGAGIVQGGAHRLNTGAQKLDAGATRLSKGTAELARAAPRLVAGIKQGTDAVSALNTGAQALASGAGQVADGTAKLAAAAPALSQGIASAANGADQLSTGTGQVADGATKLHSGSTELADGLAEGVRKIPSYTSAERQQLSKVAATPVLGRTERVNAVVGNGAGLAPYFMALALWVGAMAIFMLLRALSLRALASTASSWRVAFSGYLPGAVLSTVQATVLVGVLEFVVGVHAANLPGLALFAILVGLTFAAINQALIATFGGAGRFLALIFVSLQLSSAGGTYPIETAPAFFQAVHDVLPMSYAVQGMRDCIAGGASGIGVDVAAMLLWLVIAGVVTIIAAQRQRTWTISRLHAASVI